MVKGMVEEVLDSAMDQLERSKALSRSAGDMVAIARSVSDFGAKERALRESRGFLDSARDLRVAAEEDIEFVRTMHRLEAQVREDSL